LKNKKRPLLVSSVTSQDEEEKEERERESEAYLSKVAVSLD